MYGEAVNAGSQLMANPSFEDLLAALAREHERKVSEVRDEIIGLTHRDAPGCVPQLPVDGQGALDTPNPPIIAHAEVPRTGRAQSSPYSDRRSYLPVPAEMFPKETSLEPAGEGPKSRPVSASSDGSDEIHEIRKSLSRCDSADSPPKVSSFRQSKSSSAGCSKDPRNTQRISVRATEMIEIAEFAEDNKAISTVVKKIISWYHRFRELEEPTRSGFLTKIVFSQYFGFLCMTVILADSVFSVFTSQQQMDTLQWTPSAATFVVEICFLVFYVFELCMKLMVHKQYFFCNRDMSWNLFDFCLVVQSIVQHMVMLAATDEENKSYEFVRVLRILKFGKIFRMFRALKFLRELRVMVMTIVGSLISLFWSIVTLALIVYIFALVFIQEMSGYLTRLKYEGNLDEKTEIEVRDMFGTVSLTMLSLYQCTNNGVDWINVYGVISPAGAFTQFLLIFFITFFNFAVLNILSGIFLEKALRNSEPDREAMALEKRRMDAEDAAALRDLFHKMDWEGNGKLSLVEFEEHISDDKVQGYLAALGIDTKDAKMFFDVLSHVNGSDDLEIEDFVDHCSHMKGNASATDMASLSYEVKLLRRELKENFLMPSSLSNKRSIAETIETTSNGSPD